MHVPNYLDPRLADRLCFCVYSVVEGLADGILGVEHGVAAFFIQSSNAIIITLLFVAVDHSRLVRGILLIVRDSTEPRIW